MAEREWEPRSWEELFPGRFLKHSHVGAGTEVTIERVYNTTVDDKLAQVARIAPVQGIEQQDWGLNKTNGLCLRAMFGDTIRDWFGKRVYLHESTVEHGREKGKPCIRIAASRDIPSDVKAVIDFHTKRIKPFTITIKAIAQAKTANKVEATPAAKAFSSQVKGATSLEALTELALSIEEYLDQNKITRDEAKSLMDGINARSKTMAEKKETNVIT